MQDKYKSRGLLFVAAATAAGVLAWAQLEGQEPASPETGSFPSLTVRSAEIRGQVLIASEREGQEEQPASRVRVQVRMPETGDILDETLTNESGEYRLRQLAPGIYRLLVGRLRLNLLVEPPEGSEGEQPKILLVIIPKGMTQFEP